MMLSEDDEEMDTAQTKAKQNKKLIWKREDITYPPRTPYSHPKPAEILDPHDYFLTPFTAELIDDIVYQTNLYAHQKDVTQHLKSTMTQC